MIKSPGITSNKPDEYRNQAESIKSGLAKEYWKKSNAIKVTVAKMV